MMGVWLRRVEYLIADGEAHGSTFFTEKTKHLSDIFEIPQCECTKTTLYLAFASITHHHYELSSFT